MKKVEDYIDKYFPIDTFVTFMVQAEIIDEANLYVGENYIEYHELNTDRNRMLSLLKSLGAHEKGEHITAIDDLDIYENMIEEGMNAVLVVDLISTKDCYADAIYDCFVYSYMDEGVIRITFKGGE